MLIKINEKVFFPFFPRFRVATQVGTSGKSGFRQKPKKIGKSREFVIFSGKSRESQA